MPNLFGRPLWSFLPIGSWVYLVGYTTAPDSEFLAYSKWFGHLLGYPLVVLAGLSLYSGAVISTKSLNPFEQYRINLERNKTKQNHGEKYENLKKQIFGPGGFADTNFDLNVDLEEKARAYKKLGFTDFPKEDLTLEQLEELVKKYLE